MSENLKHSVIQKLRQAGGVYSRHRALRIFLRSLKWVIVAIPLLMLADMLFQFPEWLRLTGLLGVLLAFLTLAIIALVTGFFLRPRLLRVARLLESRNRSLGSKLINFLQLEAETRSENSSDLTRSLASHAVADAEKSLATIDLAPLAREPDLSRQFLRAAIAPVLLILLTLLGGSAVRHEWLRFLDPFGDHPPFSFTRITIEKPVENASVLYGSSTLVEARTTGHLPRELFVTATSDDPSVPPTTLPMISRGDGSFLVPLEKIRTPLELTVHTAKHSSRSHHRKLDVILTPQIGLARIRLTPPTYTGQPPRDLPFRFNGLQVLEGTGITFEIQSNRPLGDGKFSLLTPPESISDFPLSPAAEGPAETATGNMIATDSGKLSFTLIDIAGNAAAETPTSSLTVTRDQPPAIAISVPEKDALVVDHLTVPVTVDASDDYGLRSIRLHISINGNFLPVETIDFDQPDQRSHRFTYPLDLAKTGVKSKDEITIFAEAIDTRPDPQISRTDTRKMGAISEEQYNDFLRKESDVAIIAGKYEVLLDRLGNQVEAQRQIEAKRHELAAKAAANPSDESIQKELKATAESQEQINRELDALAAEMETFGREKPVYDFELGLQEKLREQAETLRESTSKNREDDQQASEQPVAEQAQAFAKAAQEHRERLEDRKKEIENEVIEPLADLSKLHELMKNFNLFGQLTEAQKQLAEQTKAYQEKEKLTPDDRLALRSLGARQREQAAQLELLIRKLEHDSANAAELFPKAAASAKQLADHLEQEGLPGLARTAAGEMLAANAATAHPQAQQLYEKMNALFCDACQPGQQGTEDGVDQALKLTRGIKPGNTFQQMMQSLNFRAAPGGSGSGTGGFMASSMMNGMPQVIGGESMVHGPMSQALAGKGEGAGTGLATGPSAKLDQPSQTGLDRDSARRTSTPGSSSILLEYENIADAYFKRLTTPP